MMATPLFQRYGNYQQQNQLRGNLAYQVAMLKNNPGYILDILLQNRKINQVQYNELQPYKNDPEAIGRYLINSGKQGEINQAEQTANNMISQK